MVTSVCVCVWEGLHRPARHTVSCLCLTQIENISCACRAALLDAEHLCRRCSSRLTENLKLSPGFNPAVLVGFPRFMASSGRISGRVLHAVQRTSRRCVAAIRASAVVGWVIAQWGEFTPPTQEPTARIGSLSQPCTERESGGLRFLPSIQNTCSRKFLFVYWISTAACSSTDASRRPPPQRRCALLTRPMVAEVCCLRESLGIETFYVGG